MPKPQLIHFEQRLFYDLSIVGHPSVRFRTLSVQIRTCLASDAVITAYTYKTLNVRICHTPKAII